MRQTPRRLRAAAVAAALALVVSAVGVATTAAPAAATDPWPQCGAWVTNPITGSAQGACTNGRTDVKYYIAVLCSWDFSATMPDYAVSSGWTPTNQTAYASCYGGYAWFGAIAVVEDPPAPPPPPPPPPSPPSPPGGPCDPVCYIEP